MKDNDAELIIQSAEKYYGIKTDLIDAKKLETCIKEKYGVLDTDILEKIFSSGEAAEFLTVSETYFFREPMHFDFLSEYLTQKNGNLKICSAGTASGCEAYSIAILIESFMNSGINSNFKTYEIDAFDINLHQIEKANDGIYGQRSLREDGSTFHSIMEPYMNKNENNLTLLDSIKKNINFFVHNLMKELPYKDYDIIFFRNAFIYFTDDHRNTVLSNLSSALKENGLLIMGVSETANAKPKGLIQKINNDVFYFQKTV